MGVYQFVVDSDQQIGPGFVNGDRKTVKTGFLCDFFGDVPQYEDEIVFWQSEIVTGLKRRVNAFVNNPGYMFPVPEAPDTANHVRNSDTHGAHMFTFAAHGAYPRPFRIDNFFL